MPTSQLAPESNDEDVEAALGALAAATLREAPTFVGVYDAQLRARFLNSAGRTLIGLSPGSDITAYQLSDFFMQLDRALLDEVVIPTMLRDGRWSGELCFRHLTDPAQQTKVGWSLLALHGDAGKLFSPR